MSQAPENCGIGYISVAVRTCNVVKSKPQLVGKSGTVYHCYFTQDGNIEEGCKLNVRTLDAAIATGRKILDDHLEIDRCNGLEIWLDEALLYKFSA